MGNTKEGILQYIADHEPVSAHMISEAFDIHPTMTHRHLKDLQHQNMIRKKGKPPKVYYFAETQANEPLPRIDLPAEFETCIEKHFYKRSPDGKDREGVP